MYVSSQTIFRYCPLVQKMNDLLSFMIAEIGRD